MADEFDRNALAIIYGKDFGIEKKENEDNDAYRQRLSTDLRNRGRIIEAHEVMTGRRYDDPAQDKDFGPMAGITGAVAMAMRGVEYGHPERRLEDESVYGFMTRAGADPSTQYIEKVFDVLGPSTGMDFLDGARRADIGPNKLLTHSTLLPVEPETPLGKPKKKKKPKR